MSDFCRQQSAVALAVAPVLRPVVGSIRPPGSKSLTNRALMIAALADGPSRLTGVLDSRDTQVMADSLRRLGVLVEHNLESATMSLSGRTSDAIVEQADLWLENSGTSIRFLTALCSVRSGTFRLDGNERMRERPIAPLVDALRQTGTTIDYERREGYPPLIVRSSGWHAGELRVSGDLSSQYLSALLMTAPAAGRPVQIEVQGRLVSRPYIEMTLATMRQFSAQVDVPQPNRFTVHPAGYRGREYAIEPDASAASYFFGVAAVTGGTVTVEGLSGSALQGDVRFVEALAAMGCDVQCAADSITVAGRPLRGIDLDMNDISDTAQTLACIAPFADTPTRIRNVAHMRLKETDRIHALVVELRRLGLRAEEHDDGLTIFPGTPQGTVVETYDDHRMAMSLALLGLKAPGVRISDPGCTSKTYPHFFDDLDRLCAAARQAEG